MNVKNLILRLMACLLILFWTASSMAQGFRIQRFDSQMQLTKDGVLHVTEKIQVIFSEPKRGIFRTIPVDYPAPNGTIRSIRVTNIGVQNGLDGSRKKKVSREWRNLNIRIGDPDVYMPVGTPITYTINYSVSRMLNQHQRNGDWEPWTELYWNIFGSQWPTAIESGSFQLTFPAVPEDRQLRANVIIGQVGTQGGIQLEKRGASHGLRLDSNSLTMTLPGPINPGEEATIIVGLPQDLVSKQPAFDQFLENVEPYGGLLIAAPLLIVGFITWLLIGRDPWAGRVKVAFDPPDKLSPAHFGALIDESLDPRDIAAAIVGLAVKGCLTINPVEAGGRKTATLHLTGKLKSGKTLSEFEAKLLQDIGDGGNNVDELDLRANVAPQVPAYRSDIYSSLVALGYYPASPAGVREVTAVGGSVLSFFSFIAFFGLGLQSAQWWSIGLGILLCFVFVKVFAKIMPSATRKGSAAKAHARGFAEFLSKREHYMNWFAEKMAPQAMFEEYLPYAVALGIEARWVKSFEGVLTEPIEWYQGGYDNLHDFGRGIGFVSNNLAATAGVPPRATSDGSGSGGGGGGSAWGGGSGFSGGSSGGGGYSGGGFGGGGGGSW